jgi:hypothetical protein
MIVIEDVDDDFIITSKWLNRKPKDFKITFASSSLINNENGLLINGLISLSLSLSQLFKLFLCFC